MPGASTEGFTTIDGTLSGLRLGSSDAEVISLGDSPAESIREFDDRRIRQASDADGKETRSVA